MTPVLKAFLSHSQEHRREQVGTGSGVAGSWAVCSVI